LIFFLLIWLQEDALKVQGDDAFDKAVQPLPELVEGNGCSIENNK
jgi:hypothetical protein